MTYRNKTEYGCNWDRVLQEPHIYKSLKKVKGQSKKSSLLEQVLNVGSGFLISYFVLMLIITPIFELDTNSTDNFFITVIFTVISVIRGYLWRRAFNYITHKGQST